jgi:hypothetical protein
MIEICEVVDVVGIYDSNVKKPDGSTYPIGTIKVSAIGSTNTTGIRLAIPASTIRRIPLKHELVACFNAPILGANEGRVDTGLYYLDPVNIQNTVHINVLPEMAKPGTFLGGTGTNTAKNYTLANNTIVPDKPIKFGEDFVEADNVQFIQPYEGDTLLESRYGSSIRMGGSFPRLKTKYQEPAPWKSSDPGAPIIVLRNGRRNNVRGNVFIVENPIDDASSIYLTSTQRLSALQTSQRNIGLGVTPITAFNSSQIAAWADRVVINAKTDYIVLSAAKSVNIATPNWAVDMDSFFTIVSNLLQQVTQLNSQVSALNTSLNAFSAANLVTYGTLPILVPLVPATTTLQAGLAPVTSGLSSITTQLTKITTQLKSLAQ